MRCSLPALDGARLAAAALVVAIHTSPLTTYSALGDFYLTRVLARLAVPFFLMVSGYFLARGGWKGVGRLERKMALLYGAAILLYLPLNFYRGMDPVSDWPRLLLFDGTFYHLWYFPAVMLGVLIAWQLARLGLRVALPVAGLLYLVGLGGDSYYGFLSGVPALESFYQALFQLSSYTRNGLFFAPLFLLLGAAGVRFGPRLSALGAALSFAAMSAEGLWLHSLDVQRHDSMYVFLPVCMVFLFSLLLHWNRGECRPAREVSALVYLLHPWCIVLVRGAAEVLGWEGALVTNSLGHYLAVLASSAGLSVGFCLLRHRLLLPPLSRRARAWREVDENALRHNARVLQRALGPRCRLMAVVKADAYGHGAVRVARSLEREGVHTFAVATLVEGIALRRAGIRGVILILGWTPPEEAARLARWRLTQAVADEAHGKALAAQGRTVHVHLALDTGMHRLGIPADDHEAIARLYRLPRLKIDGVFSHLCLSDRTDDAAQAFTQSQLERFYRTLDWMRAAGCRPGRVHIQASYGVWNLPEQPCHYARVGIALYGVGSDRSPVRQPLDLRPVLSLRARVATVRTLAEGEGAGYGLAFRAERETRLAVVSIGYADGIPRDLGARGGGLLLHGQRCPIVGRVCMDQLLADVTEVEGVQPGDTATLIGRDGGAEIRAEELAETCGTITNELLSRLGARLG